ncbi:MAG: MFS transporter [Steroidobacteraceae bacterium]
MAQSRHAFLLLAALAVAFLAAASAPTPLYPVYQALWGLTSFDVGLVFGVYAVAVLTSLLVVGRLSDHIGRRPVMLVAIAAQLVSLALIGSAGSLGVLLVGRVLQGLSTGAAVAAIGAALLDLDRQRGAVANAVTVPVGTALGGVIAGLLVSFLPAPTHLVYLVLGAVLVALGVGIWRLSETVAPIDGALASLRPTLRVSAGATRPLLLAVPAIISAWALPGFFSSLGPALMREVMGIRLLLAGGLLLFVMAGAAALTVFLARKAETRQLAVGGAVALLAGMIVTSGGLAWQSSFAFFAGAVISGAGFGAAFQGALRSVLAAAHAHERAATLSVVFVIAYLAMGIPAIAAGWLVARDGNLLLTAREFVAVILALSGLAVVASLARPAAAAHIARA